jgi:YHS domain-containing protein
MTATDPVCGKQIDTLRARAVAIVDGVTYYFCSSAHKEQFLRDKDWARPSLTPPPQMVDAPRGEKPAEKPAVEDRPPAANVPVEIAATQQSAKHVDAEKSQPYAEVKITPRESSSTLRYVVMVLLVAVGAVAYILLTHHAE